MTEQIKIDVDVGDSIRGIKRLARYHYPYALALSLTMTAKDGQGAVRAKTRRIYNIRNKFTLRNIKIKPALKSDVRTKHVAYSEVKTDPKITHYMPAHEPGERRKGISSAYIAVPTYDLLRRRYRTSRGVKKAYDPVELMKQSTEARNARIAGKRHGAWKQKGRSKKKVPFIIQSKARGVPILVKRRTQNRLPLLYMWVFKKVVKIPAKWGFEKAVKRRANRKFPKHFRNAMRKAMASTR